ncbi:lytic murein transglycosylase [Streptacidiphilus sp. EB103A]|uniref:lytic transglycosylase domain-containing protein n=1 Tax=Streptacidiphilus sp. EB103A TaxID=3156275 RepID=UPI00351506A1
MHPELPSHPRPPRRVSQRQRPAAGPDPRRRAAPVGVGALLALVFLGGSQALGAVVPVSPSPQQAPPLTATGDSAPLDLAPPPAVSATAQFTVPTPVGTATTAAGSSASPVRATGAGSVGIPAVVLAAYRRAEASVAVTTPGCHLSWTLLAAIGQVESGQAEGGDVSANGTTLHPILGPLLDGSSGTAAIRDAGGNWARAQGPMQFLPSTWATWGADGNGDGVADPNNVFDAALAAGHYLCAGSRDLNQSGDLRGAILSYNHSDTYANTVLAWMSYYQHSVVTGVAPVTPSATPTSPTATATATTAPPASATASATPSATPSRTTSTPRPSASASSGRPSASPTPDPSASTSGTPAPTGTPTPSATASSPAGCPTTATPTAGTPTPTPTPTPSTSAPTTPPATACPSSTPTSTASPSTAVPTNSTAAASSTPAVQ